MFGFYFLLNHIFFSFPFYVSVFASRANDSVGIFMSGYQTMPFFLVNNVFFFVGVNTSGKEHSTIIHFHVAFEHVLLFYIHYVLLLFVAVVSDLRYMHCLSVFFCVKLVSVLMRVFGAFTGLPSVASLNNKQNSHNLNIH